MRPSISHRIHPPGPNVRRAGRRRGTRDRPVRLQLGFVLHRKGREENSTAPVYVERDGKLRRLAHRPIEPKQGGRASRVTRQLRAGLQRAFRTVPIDHKTLTGAAQITRRDCDEGVFPLHIFQVNLERTEIRRHKFARQFDLCPKNGRIVNPAMQLLGFRVARDLERFGEKECVCDQHLFHLAPLDMPIGHGRVLHRFEFVLNGLQTGPMMFCACPRIGRYCLFRRSSDRSARLDHGHWNQHHEDQRPTPKVYDGAVAPHEAAILAKLAVVALAMAGD